LMKTYSRLWMNLIIAIAYEAAGLVQPHLPPVANNTTETSLTPVRRKLWQGIKGGQDNEGDGT